MLYRINDILGYINIWSYRFFLRKGVGDVVWINILKVNKVKEMGRMSVCVYFFVSF